MKRSIALSNYRDNRRCLKNELTEHMNQIFDTLTLSSPDPQSPSHASTPVEPVPRPTATATKLEQNSGAKWEYNVAATASFNPTAYAPSQITEP